MKSSDLLKSTHFNYSNLFIKKISEYNLSLNEFLLLNYFINYNVSEFIITDAEKNISLSSKDILEAYNGLITKKIISIKTSNKNGVIYETINLDNFYEKLDQNIKKDKIDVSIDEVIKAFEDASGEKVTDMEKEIINSWFVSGFESSMIISAIKESKYNGICNIRYIDKTINEWIKKGIKDSKQLEDYLRKNTSSDEKLNLFDYDWLDEK